MSRMFVRPTVRQVRSAAVTADESNPSKAGDYSIEPYAWLKTPERQFSVSMGRPDTRNIFSAGAARNIRDSERAEQTKEVKDSISSKK